MLRSLTAPLYHTHWEQHKGCILTDKPSRCRKAWHQLQIPKKNIKKRSFSNKTGNKCETTAVNWFWDVCLLSQPSLSARPSPDQVSASCTELLLGNVEEFGVWPWSGSLCANPYHRFLQILGAVHISIKTLQPYQGDITKTTLISCFSK